MPLPSDILISLDTTTGRFGITVFENPAILGYGLAATVSGLSLLALLGVGRKFGGPYFLLAICSTVIWSGGLIYLETNAPAAGHLIIILELLHDTVWLAFLFTMMKGALLDRSNPALRYAIALLFLSLVVTMAVLDYAELPFFIRNLQPRMLLAAPVFASILAIVAIEQILRNARRAQLRDIKLLLLGAASIALYDILLFSISPFNPEWSVSLWNARGYAVSLGIATCIVGLRSAPRVHRRLFLSRQVVMHSTTLVVFSTYLLVVALAAVFIRRLESDWTQVLSVVFVFGSLISMSALLASERLRGRMRVFLAKNFFERKYDYRSEWLRLNHTITNDESPLPLQKRAIKALAQILNSESGRLWMSDESSNCLRPATSWNIPPSEFQMPADDSFIKFLARTEWVIDTEELPGMQAKHLFATSAAAHELVSEMAFVIPLFHEEEMIGLVTLTAPRLPHSLDFEDHDLLKAAARQIGSYLAQQASSEQLAENRQFEAFNRLTAFIMHDLKNAVAQQTLIVSNAEKHKNNPAFIDDVIETIRSSLFRMRRILSHLSQRSTHEPVERINVRRLVEEAVSQCSDRSPIPTAEFPDSETITVTYRDRLLMAICHAIRNAQDATPAGGRVHVRVSGKNRQCRIEITDTGRGMEVEFIRDRLFRPFDSTKGAEGMGIGAYQIRETLRLAGGSVEVDSRPGNGTRMTLILPEAKLDNADY